MSDDDSPDLLNSHFTPSDDTRPSIPDVTFKRTRRGGPTHVHLDGQPVPWPVLMDSVSIQRQGPRNILTLSILVGDVHMDDCRKTREQS